MKRADLSKDKQMEYDRIIDDMMSEIEALPDLEMNKNRLDSGNDRKRREIVERYIPKIKALFGEEVK